MQVSTGNLGADLLLKNSRGHGRLAASPAYYQTAGDVSVQLDSADARLAVKISPMCDWELDALSSFVTAVSTQGDQNFFIYSDGAKPEPNGALNGSMRKLHADQTDNSTPLTVSATSEDGGGSNPAWRAFNGDGGTTYWKSGADPATTPQSLEIDLGAGVEKWVNKLLITSANEGNANLRCFAADFTLEAKEDGGASYDTLLTVTGESDGAASSIYDYSWTPTKPYRYFRINITDSNGTGAFVCIGEMEWIEAANESAPSETSLKSLGAVSSGASADRWTRLQIDSANRYRFQRGKPVWLVCKGTAGADFSLSVNTQTDAVASGFPDEMSISKYTTDGGVSWSRCLGTTGLVNAMWNVILNSTADHVPQLIFGRVAGTSIYIPGSGAMEIPEAGVFLDCTALTAGSAYNVYAYNNGGALDLEASTTDQTLSDGIEVKGGDSTKRFLGRIAPLEIQTAKQGPVDVSDYRAVANRYNRQFKSLLKRPYHAGTSHEWGTPNRDIWKEAAESDGDLTVWVLALEPTFIDIGYNVQIDAPLGTVLSIAIGDEFGLKTASGGQCFSEGVMTYRVSFSAPEGLLPLIPIMRSPSKNTTIYLRNGQYEIHWSTAVTGNVYL